jgi:transcription antitermination factor NusG
VILQYGDIKKLKGLKWNILEVRSERTVENVIRRVGKTMPAIFKDGGACEVFVPIEDRDLNLFSLKTSSYIFLRSDRKRELQKFKGITGVVGILCEGEQQRIDKALQVEDSYVQSLIKETREQFEKRPESIQVGSFVRILDGLDKGFCGHVSNIERGFALIRIELKTRQMFIDTPLHNLKDLSHVPKHSRVFYYSELVDDYVKEYDEEATLTLHKDLNFEVESVDPTPLDEPDEKKVKYGRQKTVTAMTKKLIYAGVRDPKIIIKETLAAIEAYDIKKPKSAFIFYSILKQAIMETLFKDDERIKTYKDVVKYHGDSYRFSPKMIAELDERSILPSKSEISDKSHQHSTVIKIKLIKESKCPPILE